MSDVNDSVRIDGKAARMRLDGEHAEELSIGCKSLDTLIAKLSRMHFVVLSDRNSDASVEFSFTLATPAPFQQELRSGQSVVERGGPRPAHRRETASTGNCKKLPSRHPPCASPLATARPTQHG